MKDFASCPEHIKTFLLSKGIEYPELNNDEWLQNFYISVDMTSHLNNLNKNLQGRGNIARTLLEQILSFEQKLTLFVQDKEN